MSHSSTLSTTPRELSTPTEVERISPATEEQQKGISGFIPEKRIIQYNAVSFLFTLMK